MLEGNPKDVLVVDTTVLHGLNQTPGLVPRHGSILFKDALEGPADISGHRDVPTHIEMASLFHQQLDDLLSILFQ